MSDTNEPEDSRCRSFTLIHTLLSLTLMGLFLYLVVQFFVAKTGLRGLTQQCHQVAKQRQGINQTLEQLYHRTCSTDPDSALCQSLGAALRQQQQHQQSVWNLCQNIQSLRAP